MADECLMAIPDIEGIDYTTKEYLKFVTHIQNAALRLNKESTYKFTIHVLCSFYVKLITVILPRTHGKKLVHWYRYFRCAKIASLRLSLCIECDK